jgi:hypothetical protein
VLPPEVQDIPRDMVEVPMDMAEIKLQEDQVVIFWGVLEGVVAKVLVVTEIVEGMELEAEALV